MVTFRELEGYASDASSGKFKVADHFKNRTMVLFCNRLELS